MMFSAGMKLIDDFNSPLACSSDVVLSLQSLLV
jgi:hypothetical protein